MHEILKNQSQVKTKDIPLSGQGWINQDKKTTYMYSQTDVINNVDY